MKLKKILGKKQNPNFAVLSRRLEKRSQELITEFEEKHKDALEYLERRGIDADHILQKGGRRAAAGLAAGIVLLSSGLVPEKNLPTNTAGESLITNQIIGEAVGRQDTKEALLKIFSNHLPRNVKHLSVENERVLTDEISKNIGIKVTAELDGNHLNTSYGKIGLEQHLPRYPGDNIQEHFESGVSANIYGKSRLTRNRGAFGYFAPNKFALTKENIEEEKYYVVVQTFDIPGYNSSKAAWYKHRKVLVVNTENGRSVVGDIADAGPAKWTGKSFGGSPELMDHLQMYRGSRKAKVLIFFIDDVRGTVKLGPI